MRVFTGATPGDVTVTGVRLPGGAALVDLEVRNGRVAAVRASGEADAGEHVALPAFVDLHTHLREPGGEAAETIATGTMAAAAGGYSDVFAMANTVPVTDSVERVERMRAMASGASARVHVVAAATLGQAGASLVDVEALRAAGVTVFSDDGHCVEDDGLVYELLRRLSSVGGVFAQHAQSGSIVGSGVVNERVASSIGCAGWPPVGEEAIVARDIAIARATGGRLHVCHVSTRRTVELVRWAKAVGAPVTAEVTPHHLTLTDQEAVERGPLLKVNPPLRSEDDVVALREGLRDGTIDAVGTDHAPHPREAKSRPWPQASFGMTAIETALPIVAEVLTDPSTGDVDWRRLIEVMSSAPAAIGGLADRTGAVRPGATADFCVVESGGRWSVDASSQLSRSRNTPFDGRQFSHRVVLSVVSGRVTYSAITG